MSIKEKKRKGKEKKQERKAMYDLCECDGFAYLMHYLRVMVEAVRRHNEDAAAADDAAGAAVKTLANVLDLSSSDAVFTAAISVLNDGDDDIDDGLLVIFSNI